MTYDQNIELKKYFGTDVLDSKTRRRICQYDIQQTKKKVKLSKTELGT